VGNIGSHGTPIIAACPLLRGKLRHLAVFAAKVSSHATGYVTVISVNRCRALSFPNQEFSDRSLVHTHICSGGHLENEILGNIKAHSSNFTVFSVVNLW